MIVDYLDVTDTAPQYVYANGRIRGMEKLLLQDADPVRLREAGSVGEMEELLRTYPAYAEIRSEATGEGGWEDTLEQRLGWLHQELRSFAPEPLLVDCFWWRYDFHNLKVLLRARYQEKDISGEVSSLLVGCGAIETDVLRDAVSRQDYGMLPAEVASILGRISPELEHHADPWLIDTLLSRELYGMMSRTLAAYEDAFLDEIRRRLIDRHNLVSFLRMKAWTSEPETERLRQVMVSGGSAEPGALIALAGQPLAAAVDPFEPASWSGKVRAALEQDDPDLAMAETQLIESLLAFTERGFYVTFGREALINYVFRAQREVELLRTAASESRFPDNGDSNHADS